MSFKIKTNHGKVLIYKEYEDKPFAEIVCIDNKRRKEINRFKTFVNQYDTKCAEAYNQGFDNGGEY